MYSAVASGARTPRLILKKPLLYSDISLYESYQTTDMCEILARLDSWAKKPLLHGDMCLYESYKTTHVCSILACLDSWAKKSQAIWRHMSLWKPQNDICVCISRTPRLTSKTLNYIATKSPWKLQNEILAEAFFKPFQLHCDICCGY